MNATEALQAFTAAMRDLRNHGPGKLSAGDWRVVVRMCRTTELLGIAQRHAAGDRAAAADLDFIRLVNTIKEIGDVAHALVHNGDERALITLERMKHEDLKRVREIATLVSIACDGELARRDDDRRQIGVAAGPGTLQ